MEFKYENLPIFCFYCGRVGHGERMCERKKEDSQKSELHEGQFREGIRAVNGRGMNKHRSWEKKDEGYQVVRKIQSLEGGTTIAR